MLETFRLDGKCAVVTGSGRGLGRAMAVALAEAGAKVVIAARTESQINETMEIIKQYRNSIILGLGLALIIFIQLCVYIRLSDLDSKTAFTKQRNYYEQLFL